jgi:hypothetical protein
MIKENPNWSNASKEKFVRYRESRRFFQKLAAGTIAIGALWLLSAWRPDLVRYGLGGLAGIGLLFTFYAWQAMREDRDGL